MPCECNWPTGCSITEAVALLGDKLRDYQGHFTTTHLLALCEYFHNTFIHHYKLYQYVLGQDQEVNLTITHLDVCAPPQPLPLAEGTDRDVWKHEQQVAELSMAEVQKRTSVVLLKETLQLEQEQLLQKKFSEVRMQQDRVLRREVRLGHKAGGCSPVACKRLLLSREHAGWSRVRRQDSIVCTRRREQKGIDSLSLCHRPFRHISRNTSVRYNSHPYFSDETTDASGNHIN